MTKAHIHQFTYNNDNYGFLFHDEESGETAAVDAGDSDAYFEALKETGWALTQIWVTHHHWDHVDGLGALKAQTGAKVYGPKHSKSPIKDIDVHVGEGDHFAFGQHQISIIETPGHTLDMINFHVPSVQALFSGDTLFVLGCGRLFEGTPSQMWESMQKLKRLPRETSVYCSHEYSKANADFAVTIDPDNSMLLEAKENIEALRADGKPTVPTTIAKELATNPFMRADDAAIRQHLGMIDASDEAVFTEIRKRKDNF